MDSNDPTPVLSKELQGLWCAGVSNQYVSAKQAKSTVGLIFKGKGKPTLSTADIYKPGIPYGYPLFKVHKLSKQQLEEKKIPPTRFVTDLSNSVSARSDKFLVWQWLGPLARDYAIDLVKDSTAALIKLEDFSEATKVDNSMLSFSIDVVSLYDSLNHKLVFEALDDAMEVCRPDWSPDFRKWVKDLLVASFKSAVVKFEDTWYAGVNGIPTGGIPSVDAGNISVYYVLKKLVYLVNVKPKELLFFLRFVDDGTGLWGGDHDSFLCWFQKLRQSSVAVYGLDFTYSLNPVTENTQFLDIQYSFEDGKLTTDLYKKETDANRFLNYSSFHPRHMFESIVYSQGIRYRRIINDDNLFLLRLVELRGFFIKSSYPEYLVDRALDKVRSRPRILQYKAKAKEEQPFVPWIVTYGAGFDEAKKMAVEVNEILANSSTWGDKTPERSMKVKVISRRSPNIKDLLFKRRSISMSSSETSLATVPCTKPEERKRGRPCQSCMLMSGTPEIRNNDRTAKSAGGNCKSKGLIYAAQCVLCFINNTYAGKTVQELHCRINAHRHSFFDILKLCNNIAENENPIELENVDDTNVLGAHLYLKHGKIEKSDFNKYFKFTILKFVMPSNIRIVEQSFIDSLNTLYPFGLNNVKSISG
jgi:hypothetical protein